MRKYKYLIIATALLFSVIPDKAFAGQIWGGQINSLRAHWTFESAKISGTSVYDMSGKGTTATMVGSPTTAQSGKVGRSILLSGTGQYLTGPTGTMNCQFSMGGWVKNNGANSDAVLIGMNWSDDIRTYLGVGNGYLSAQTTNPDNDTDVNSYTGQTEYTVNDGNWHHVFLTMDSANDMRLYYDGALVETVATQSACTGNMWQTFAMGAGYSGSAVFARTWSGYIDDMRVYSRTLTTSEIANMYAYGFLGMSAPAQTSVSPILKSTPTLQNSLIGYWSFDGNNMSGASVLDSSGQSKNGTLVGGAKFVTGKFGQAIQFNGTNSYITYGDVDSYDFGTSDFSINVWIKTTYKADYQHIIGKRYDNTTWYRLITNVTDGYAIFELGNSFPTNLSSVTGTTNVCDGKWHMITAVRSNGTAYVYVDGVQENSGAANFSISNADAFSIGAYNTASGWNNYFRGTIDNAQVFNRVLTLNEIKQLYKQGSVGQINATPSAKSTDTLLTNLVGHWTFDGAKVNDTAAIDSSVTGANGTLTGTLKRLPGKYGQSILFNGTNGYINMGNVEAYNFGSNDFSISAWIKTSYKGDYQHIVGKRRDNTTWYRLLTNVTDGYAIFELGNSFPTNLSSVTGTTNVCDGKWHLITGVRSGGTAYIYVDGVQQNSGAANYSVSNSDDFIIGAYTVGASWGNYFRGYLDDVRAYSRALTSTEVLRMYYQGK